MPYGDTKFIISAKTLLLMLVLVYTFRFDFNAKLCYRAWLGDITIIFWRSQLTFYAAVVILCSLIAEEQVAKRFNVI